jgi:hypothetical protein
MPMHVAHEANEIRRSRIVVQEFVVKPQPHRPRRPGDRGDGRNPIPSIPRSLNGRISRRRPNAAPQRLQQIPAFIEKNQASLTFEALFLVAAKIRDASERCPPRSFRGHVAPASADSSPTDAASAARIPDESPRQTIAGSCRARSARSNPRVHSPKTAYRAPTQPSIRFVGTGTAWGSVPDATSTAGDFHASTPPSSGALMKCWNQRSRPHPSTACPSRTAWPRFADGPRAFQGFQLVSCCNCMQPTTFSIN